MAVTNFRASDFPKGKASKSGPDADRADNKVLQESLDNAVEDPKAGDKVANKAAKDLKVAEATLESEISNTVDPNAAKAEDPDKKK